MVMGSVPRTHKSLATRSLHTMDSPGEALSARRVSTSLSPRSWLFASFLPKPVRLHPLV